MFGHSIYKLLLVLLSSFVISLFFFFTGFLCLSSRSLFFFERHLGEWVFYNTDTMYCSLRILSYASFLCLVGVKARLHIRVILLIAFSMLHVLSSMRFKAHYGSRPLKEALFIAFYCSFLGKYCRTNIFSVSSELASVYP